jgi:hypothetical protein
MDEIMVPDRLLLLSVREVLIVGEHASLFRGASPRLAKLRPRIPAVYALN